MQSVPLVRFHGSAWVINKIGKKVTGDDYGAFLWIIDPDGNKVELWEPKLWDDKNKKC